MVRLNEFIDNFDANEVPDDDREYSPIPPGEYMAIVTDTEMRETKSGTGKYLAVTIQLTGNPEYDGRLVFENLNLVNDNPKTVEIAYRNLASLCKAVGVISPQDTAELHDKPFKVKVGIEPARGEWPERNKVKGYAKASATGAPSPSQQTAEAPRAKKPWEN